MESRFQPKDLDERPRREPTLYDEWLNEEKVDKPPVQLRVQTKTTNSIKSRRAGSTAGLSVSSPGNLATRNRPPSSDQDHGSSLAQFTAAGPVAAPSSAFDNQARSKQNSLSSSSKTRTSLSSSKYNQSGGMESPSPPLNNPFTGERAWLQDNSSAKRIPAIRSTSGGVSKSKGLLGRRSSKANAEAVQPLSSSPTTVEETVPYNRPRTRTLDERRAPLSPSPTRNNIKPRQRIGSVHASTQMYRHDTDPTRHPQSTEPLPAALVSPGERAAAHTPVARPSSERSTQEPVGSRDENNADATASTTNALSKRIQHLMKALQGRMTGMAYFRRDPGAPWSHAYCFIQEQSGSLLYESQAGDGVHRLLVPDLRGCHVDFRSEDYVPYIVVRSAQASQEVHLRLHNQADFDSWLAVLLTWHHKGHRSLQTATVASPTPSPSTTKTTTPHTRRSSAARSISPQARHRADSDRSRRKSAVMSLKEAPVIKIGKMIFWDTDAAYNGNVAVGQPAVRPSAYRMQSYGTRRWRRISAQLRENGELKLHADVDNSLLSVVQLSQLSRCAVQRLDPSVLDNEFCIALYPQYTSSPTDSVTAMRPIFLSLESRVLHEVWFVLLRAFTIPQLYGPRLPEDYEGEERQDRDMDKVLAESTADMFRMERALNIRVVEAKLYPITPNEVGTPTARQMSTSRPDQFGYHVEILLDNETRAKTAVKYEGLNPLWGETFDFADLPPVLTSTSIVVKRRPPDAGKTLQDGRSMHDIYGFSNDAHGGFSSVNFDVTCGKVEIYLDELAAANEVDKWWPIVNMFNQRVGEVLVKARAEEGVVLMARDYQPLHGLLHNFSNGLTLQLAQIVPSELRRLSDCLLNIFQVSGRAGDWIMALVEDEIDSIHKETPITRLRYVGRTGATDTNDNLGSGGGHSDRELIVRDMNKNAALEANLLFRGNTLLTKSLDSHMRRVGRDFLEEALASKLKDICEKDPDCEVDPNRASDAEVSRNWRKLLYVTSEVWKSIIAAKHKCPIELRKIFRHIRACAEDRYGDFLRSVSYSSVSGFLFLRFFCPAVLNPKLFGLMKDDMKPKGRRTLTLVAKSLQTLANMASFGTKEQWMEPMNVFLNQSRESFKSFIDDICYIPNQAPSRTAPPTPVATSPNSIVSADTHLSYTTPMTIMQRLPPTSREGFPSLPYLIDQPRAFAELVQLWLETTSDSSTTRDTAFPGKSKADLLAAIRQTEGDVKEFHDTCTKIYARTQECLSRAERAERPNSALSFQWEELIDQLQSPTEENDLEHSSRGAFPKMSNSTVDVSHATRSHNREEDVSHIIGSFPLRDAGQIGQRHDLNTQRSNQTMSIEYHDKHIPQSSSSTSTYHPAQAYRLRRDLNSRESDVPTSPTDASNLSSAVSSDTDHTTGTTALPNYDKEVRQRQWEEYEQYNQHSREQTSGKEKQKGINFVSALRKKRNEHNSLPHTP